MKKVFLFCVLVFFVTVTSSAASMPPVLSVYISCSTNGCQVACNQSTGSLTAEPSNGTPPYTYLWSTSATTQSISNLPAGVYTVTVFDAMGDTSNAAQNISNLTHLEGGIVAIPY